MQVYERVDWGDDVDFVKTLSNKYSVVAQPNSHLIHIRHYVELGTGLVIQLKKSVALIPVEMSMVLGLIDSMSGFMREPTPITIQ